MPCHDYDDSSYRYRETKLTQEIAFLQAALCQTLRAFSNFNELDIFDESVWPSGLELNAGVSKAEIQRWWEEHKIKDAARLAMEKEKARIAALKKSALDKLTDEEKKLLGLL